MINWNTTGMDPVTVILTKTGAFVIGTTAALSPFTTMPIGTLLTVGIGLMIGPYVLPAAFKLASATIPQLLQVLWLLATTLFYGGLELLKVVLPKLLNTVAIIIGVLIGVVVGMIVGAIEGVGLYDFRLFDTDPDVEMAPEIPDGIFQPPAQQQQPAQDHTEVTADPDDLDLDAGPLGDTPDQ